MKRRYTIAAALVTALVAVDFLSFRINITSPISRYFDWYGDLQYWSNDNKSWAIQRTMREKSASGDLVPFEDVFGTNVFEVCGLQPYTDMSGLADRNEGTRNLPGVILENTWYLVVFYSGPRSADTFRFRAKDSQIIMPTSDQRLGPNDFCFRPPTKLRLSQETQPNRAAQRIRLTVEFSDSP